MNQKWFHWYVFVSKNLVFCVEKAHFKPHNDILNALFLINQPRFGMCPSQNVRLTILFLNKLIPKLSLENTKDVRSGLSSQLHLLALGFYTYIQNMIMYDETKHRAANTARFKGIPKR